VFPVSGSAVELVCISTIFFIWLQKNLTTIFWRLHSGTNGQEIFFGKCWKVSSHPIDKKLPWCEEICGHWTWNSISEPSTDFC
jgi:hypothetical protein